MGLWDLQTIYFCLCLDFTQFDNFVWNEVVKTDLSIKSFKNDLNQSFLPMMNLIKPIFAY